jgi:hypothetical protein
MVAEILLLLCSPQHFFLLFAGLGFFWNLGVLFRSLRVRLNIFVVELIVCKIKIGLYAPAGPELRLIRDRCHNLCDGIGRACQAAPRKKTQFCSTWNSVAPSKKT